MILSTTACANHLPQAMVMAKSYKENHHDATIVLCLNEEEIHSSLENFPYFDHVILAKDLEIPNFTQFNFKYNRYESCCAIKAYLLIYVFNYYPNENKFVYLDSDTKVFGPFEEVEELLNEHTIILTPHHIEPFMAETSCLKNGIFNGGFLALQRSDEASAFLQWWQNRVYEYCYIDPPRGMFLDQKWLDFVPCYFKRHHILDHPGYNVANWNFPQRKIEQLQDGQYLVNGEPLRFMHFSGLEAKWFNKRMKIYFPDKQENIYSLLEQYKSEIDEQGYKTMNKDKWSYDYFESGKPIDNKTRTIFRGTRQIQQLLPNPFKKSNSHILKIKNKKKKKKTIEKIQKDQIKISVVMAVYNAEPYIKASVKSILAQTYKNIEFIIINDGSTDRTRRILESITDPRVKVIHLNENGGVAQALNHAINMASGEWIAIQDADDISLPTRIEELVNYIYINPQVIAVGSLIRNRSDDKTISKRNLENFNRYWNSLLTNDQMRQHRIFQTPFCHGSSMYSKKAFQKVGGYNPDFKITHDWDLWLRLFDKGGSFGKIPRVLYEYRLSANSVSHSKWGQTYREILELTTRYILDIYTPYSSQPQFIVIGTQEACQRFQDYLMDQALKIKKFIPIQMDRRLPDILSQIKWEGFDGILVLDGPKSNEIINVLGREGMELNRNLFKLHNGFHGLIEKMI